MKLRIAILLSMLCLSARAADVVIGTGQPTSWTMFDAHNYIASFGGGGGGVTTWAYPTGLMVNYHANKNWLDYSTNANNGIPSAQTTFSSNYKFGGFSGCFSNAYAKVTATQLIPSCSNSFSISFWAFCPNPDGVSLSTPVYLNPVASGYGYLRLGGSYTSGTVTAYSLGLRNAAGTWVSSAPNTFTTANDGNVWRHLCATYDAAATPTCHFYKDGSELSIPTQTLISTFCTNVLFSWNGGNYSFIGLIDECAFFNRALTLSEVQSIYSSTVDSSATIPTFLSGLVSAWHCETNWLDATTNADDGTASNATFTNNAAFGTYAGSFNGTSASVTTPNRLAQCTNQFTLSFWVNALEAIDSAAVINVPVSLSPNSSDNVYVRLGGKYNTTTSSNSVAFRASSWASAAANTFVAATDAHVWRHITVTYDTMLTPSIHLYKDTNELPLVYDALEKYGAIDTNVVVKLGAAPDGSYFFPGFIDEAGIWNRALTASEVMFLQTNAIPIIY